MVLSNVGEKSSNPKYPNAQSGRWDDPKYQPNLDDIKKASEMIGRGDPQKQKEMEEALREVY